MIVEAIFLEFDMICIGVCDKDMRSLVLNPTAVEITEEFRGNKIEMFAKYNMGLLMSTDAYAVNELASFEMQPAMVDTLVDKLYDAEITSYLCSNSKQLRNSLHSVPSENETRAKLATLLHRLKSVSIPLMQERNASVDKPHSKSHSNADKLVLVETLEGEIKTFL